MDNNTMYMGLIFILVIFLVWYYMYYNKKPSVGPIQPPTEIPTRPPSVLPGPPSIETFKNNGNIFNDNYKWNETLLRTIDPKIKENHAEYVSNVTRFGGSTVRNFDIEEMATNPMFTNFVGMRRPQYIPINITNRQVPDIDVSPTKTNKRFLYG